MIQRHGMIWLAEPCVWFLWVEIISAPVIALLAIGRTIKDIKKIQEYMKWRK